MESEEILIETSPNNGNGQAQLSSVDGHVLKQNIDKLIALVQQFGQDATGSLTLDEVDICIKISAAGKVILVGEGESTGAITLRFRRSPAAATATSSASSMQSLPSAVGIDYSRLKNLLIGGRWQEANQETWDLMCMALHKNKGSYLSSEDINQIPCQDLQTIDSLWRNSSQGQFGFSIQNRTYKASR